LAHAPETLDGNSDVRALRFVRNRQHHRKAAPIQSLARAAHHRHPDRPIAHGQPERDGTRVDRNADRVNDLVTCRINLHERASPGVDHPDVTLPRRDEIGLEAEVDPAHDPIGLGVDNAERRRTKLDCTRATIPEAMTAGAIAPAMRTRAAAMICRFRRDEVASSVRSVGNCAGRHQHRRSC
jgi:hypothetical protein